MVVMKLGRLAAPASGHWHSHKCRHYEGMEPGLAQGRVSSHVIFASQSHLSFSAFGVSLLGLGEVISHHQPPLKKIYTGPFWASLAQCLWDVRVTGWGGS